MSCGGGCSVLGALIVSPGSPTPDYTKPMRRSGESAVVSIDVAAFSSASGILQVFVEHKNRGDTSWAALGAFSNITAAGLHWLNASGVKEEVRMKFQLDVSAVHGDFARVGAINWTWFRY